MPPDLDRHEIVDGEHFVTSPPLDRYQGAVGNLHRYLANFLAESRLGVVRVAPSGVLLGEHDVLLPDLYVVLEENLGGFRRIGFEGAPDLVVEVLSPGNIAYDLRRKLPRYELAGVCEYWAVDPAAARVEVYRRPSESEAFARPLFLEQRLEDTLETPLLPGFSLDLKALFDPGLLPEEVWED